MARYGCTVEWSRGSAAFTDLQYSRAHTWRFDGGAVVPGSSSPHSVACLSPIRRRRPGGGAGRLCLQLPHVWSPSLAAAEGYVVDSYNDAAEAQMGPIGFGRQGITDIVLRPQVDASARAPMKRRCRGPAPRGARALLHRQLSCAARAGGRQLADRLSMARRGSPPLLRTCAWNWRTRCGTTRAWPPQPDYRLGMAFFVYVGMTG